MVSRRGSLLLTLVLTVASIGMGFAMQDRHHEPETLLRTLETAREQLQEQVSRKQPDDRTLKALHLVDAAIGEIRNGHP